MPHFQRIRDVTESFPYLEFLGTFHSHPYSKGDYTGKVTSMFSGIDERTALEIAIDYENDLVEVILGITALDKRSKREAKSEEETIESYCGRFKYSLSAYCTFGTLDNDSEDNEDEECKMGLSPVDRLICPLAAYGGRIFEPIDL